MCFLREALISCNFNTGDENSKIMHNLATTRAKEKQKLSPVFYCSKIIILAGNAVRGLNVFNDLHIVTRS